eukprot:tig00020961_g16671.t1
MQGSAMPEPPPAAAASCCSAFAAVALGWSGARFYAGARIRPDPSASAWRRCQVAPAAASARHGAAVAAELTQDDRKLLEALAVVERPPRALRERAFKASLPTSPQAARLVLLERGLWTPRGCAAAAAEAAARADARSFLRATSPFSGAALDEAGRLAGRLHARAGGSGSESAWAGGGVDLRGLAAHAMDHYARGRCDDALAAAADEAARPWLLLLLADAADAVPPGSLVDETTSMRGESLYLPAGLVPMLPLALAEAAALSPDRPSNPALCIALPAFEGEAPPGAVFRCTAGRLRRHSFDGVDAALAAPAPALAPDLLFALAAAPRLPPTPARLAPPPPLRPLLASDVPPDIRPPPPEARVALPASRRWDARRRRPLTGPLRRRLDLVAHQQLAAALAGAEPPYDAAALAAEAAAVERRCALAPR